MSDKLKNLEARRRAIVQAKLLATDTDDYKDCVSDLKSDEFLSGPDAHIIATALRTKYVPSVVLQEGLTKEAIKVLDDNFAEFKKDGDDPDNKPLDTDEDVPSEDSDEDMPTSDTGEDSEDLENKEWGEEVYNDKPNKKGGLPFGNTADSEEEELGAPEGLPETGSEDLESAGGGEAQLTIEGDPAHLKEIMELIKSHFGEGNVDTDEATGEDDSFGGDTDVEGDEEISAPPFGKNKPTEKPSRFEVEDEDDFGDEFGSENETGEEFELPENARSRSMAASQNPGRKASTKMTEKEAAQRKAMRRNLVAALNDDNPPKEENWHPGMGEDTSYDGKPFQYKLKYKNEEKRNNKKFEGANPMSAENTHVKTNKQDIPTLNKRIGLEETFNETTKDGSATGNGWDDQDWKVEFDELEVPSALGNMFPGTEVPSEMADEGGDRTNVIMYQAAAKNGSIMCRHAASTRGVQTEDVFCKECGKKVELCEHCYNTGSCPGCQRKAGVDVTVEAEDGATKGGKEVEYRGSKPFAGTDDKHSGKSRDEHESEAEERDAEVMKARVKTAFHCATQMALAQAIDPTEVEAQAEQFLNSRMSPRDMLTQMKVTLRSIEAAEQRTAALYSSRMERTAANNSPISFNPTITDPNPNPRYSNSEQPSMSRIANQLSEIPWTVHRGNVEDLEDDEDDYPYSRRRASRRRR